MAKNPNSSDDANLRRRAEDRLQERPTEVGPALNAVETNRLLHELQVHMIELEMQNDELKQAMAKVESERERYSDLYNFAPVGYLTLDREGFIWQANLTCASMLGIERSQLVKRRFGVFLLTVDLPAFNAFLNKIFESKVKESCDLSLLREGKPPLNVQMEAEVVASGRECRVTLTDISDRKRAEADRLILDKLESTGILAGGIAHDFNNLLTVILINLELSRDDSLSGQELALRLKDAKGAAMMARELTEQLITFAEGGVPHRKEVDLSELIQQSVRLALSGSRVRCEFAMADDLWQVKVDSGQIGQVIRNITLNGREAMPKGGVTTIRAENVALHSHKKPVLPDGQYIHVSICDQGGGISKQVLPRIFDPYFSTKQRGNQSGMGLGLAICNSIMQKHGATIVVDSEVGMGTTFHLYFPAAERVIKKEKASEPKMSPLSPWHGRILVMDDDDAVRDSVGLLLHNMGHEVILVGDGQEAVDVYTDAKEQGCPFDVVILDLTVRDGMAGHEAMPTMFRMDPTVKGIAMSGYSNHAGIKNYDFYGFKAAIKKPFEAKELQMALSNVMRS